MSAPTFSPKGVYTFFAIELVLAGLVMLFDVVTGFGLIAIGAFAIWTLYRHENKPETLPAFVNKTFDAWFEKPNTAEVVQTTSDLPGIDALKFIEKKDTIPIWQLACLMANHPLTEKPLGLAAANLHDLKIKIANGDIWPVKGWVNPEVAIRIKFERQNSRMPVSSDSTQYKLDRIEDNTEISSQDALKLFKA